MLAYLIGYQEFLCLFLILYHFWPWLWQGHELWYIEHTQLQGFKLQTTLCSCQIWQKVIKIQMKRILKTFMGILVNYIEIYNPHR
jgi:hypothetical protein